MKRFLTLFVILLFFVSCGIPSIKDFSSSVIVSSRKSNNNFTLTFNPNSINSSYFSNGQINQYSPSILLLYTVTNQSSDAYASSFISQFKTDYRGTGGVNGLPVTIKRDSGIVEITKNDEQLYLYPLKEYNSEIYAPGYTIANNVDYTFDQYGTEFTLSLKQGEDGFTILLTNNRNSNEKELYRYTGNKKFLESDNLEYRRNSDSSDQFYIHIFAAVNVTKSTTSDFSNDYWTELFSVADIPIKY